MIKIRIEQAGMTLIELIIVIAVIGIIAGVAIPRYNYYVAKSKTREAVIALGSAYTAMETWYASYDRYGACLIQMGFSKPNGYYAVGLSGGAGLVDQSLDGAPDPCNTFGSGVSFVPATKGEGGGLKDDMGNTAPPPHNTSYNPNRFAYIYVDRNLYSIGACGNIHPKYGANVGSHCGGSHGSPSNPRSDKWVINQDKQIHHYSVGFE